MNIDMSSGQIFNTQGRRLVGGDMRNIIEELKRGASDMLVEEVTIFDNFFSSMHDDEDVLILKERYMSLPSDQRSPIAHVMALVAEWITLTTMLKNLPEARRSSLEQQFHDVLKTRDSMAVCGGTSEKIEHVRNLMTDMAIKFGVASLDDIPATSIQFHVDYNNVVQPCRARFHINK